MTPGLSAQVVIQSVNYYNTLLTIPGYTVPGYESEQYITKAHYSTDFSSNPIGSKVDFFVHLNDPCVSIVAPHPVFTIPKPLSALDTQWFNGWWDQATYYSHPLVRSQLSASYPNIYQDFSDSVGTLAYAPVNTDYNSPAFGRDTINPSIQHKVIADLFREMDKLNNDMFKLYSSFSPKGLGLKNNSFIGQVLSQQAGAHSIKLQIKGKFGALTAKLPLDKILGGNLNSDPLWNADSTIKNINEKVDKANKFINAHSPSRMLSNALNDFKKTIKEYLKKIPLPSISKLLGLPQINVTAISNTLQTLQQYGSAINNTISQVQNTLTAVQQGIASVASTINTETNQIKSIVNTVQRVPKNITGLSTVVNIGNTNAGLNYQLPNQVVGLSKNAVTIIPGTVKANGDSAAIKINTLQEPVGQ
jgi:hypothetical protein